VEHAVDHRSLNLAAIQPYDVSGATDLQPTDRSPDPEVIPRAR
jgi:hypothetical protein